MAGHIRSQDETDTLPVDLQISNSTISLRTNGDELGSWPTTSVTITEIDATTFEFVAEGDHMILLPTDPSALRDHPLVATVPVAPAVAKQRRPRKPKNEKPKPKKPNPKKAKAKKAEAKKAKPKKPETDKEPKSELAPERIGKTRRSVWIRTLDSARRHDFLGLDRVPIDESLRGQQHQHTWDHRVAATSGPGKRICTICGRVRART